MVDFGSVQFRERLADALTHHEGFALETRWFDGSILVEADEARCWLKVYRGRIIETLGSVPPFGFTFKLRGSRQAWQELISGERRLAELITPGQRRFANDPSLATADGAAPSRIAIEGNLLEATRIYEALYHFAECVARSAQ
jgi:hypothetical protein